MVKDILKRRLSVLQRISILWKLFSSSCSSSSPSYHHLPSLQMRITMNISSQILYRSRWFKGQRLHQQRSGTLGYQLMMVMVVVVVEEVNHKRHNPQASSAKVVQASIVFSLQAEVAEVQSDAPWQCQTGSFDTNLGLRHEEMVLRSICIGLCSLIGQYDGDGVVWEAGGTRPYWWDHHNKGRPSITLIPWLMRSFFGSLVTGFRKEDKASQ